MQLEQPPPDMLTSAEVATMSRSCAETVRRWHRTGKLAGVKVGGKVLYRRSVVEALLRGTP